MNPKFEIQRADDCIWLRDLRPPAPGEAAMLQEIHMVPGQAIAIAITLLKVACQDDLKEHQVPVAIPQP